MSLDGDILVPRKSPYGLFARNLEFFEAEVMNHTSRTAELRKIVEDSKVYQILVARDHGNKRATWCAPWIQYTREALVPPFPPPSAPLAPPAPAVAISPDALLIAAPEPVSSSPDAPKKEDTHNHKLVRYNPDDYIEVTFKTLMMAIMFQQFDWDKLPKQHRDLGERQVPNENFVDGLGVVTDPPAKGPERHITLKRLQRAMRQQWILSPGEHRARHEQLLVRIGSPFDVNVLSWRGTVGRSKTNVAITNIMLAKDVAVDELSEMHIYEDVSIMWAMDITLKTYELVLEVKSETDDDVI